VEIGPPASSTIGNTHFGPKREEQATMRLSSLLPVAFTRKVSRQQAPDNAASIAQEDRRQKVLEQLRARPETERVVLTDVGSDPAHVILTIATRHVYVGEMRIERSRFDPVLLQALIDCYSGKIN